MRYALVLSFVALFLFAEFKQECRLTRIARNENLTYGQFFAMTWDDAGYRASYFLPGRNFRRTSGLGLARF